MLDESTVVHLKYRSDGTQIIRELVQGPDMDRHAEKPRPRDRGFFGRSDRPAEGYGRFRAITIRWTWFVPS
ncbi:hypothetical protein ACFYW1_16860 [Streptomyces sp. NPDC002669]|uniref:hypothetical protein n=1 Tax=Streptomyces sp. NPDC002669 TaxID=3364658 RepID=UPI0036AD75E1